MLRRLIFVDTVSMKVVIISHFVIPAVNYGGTERVIWWLGKALNDLGHQVVYLCGAGSSCPFAEVLPLDLSRSLDDQIPQDADIVHLHGDYDRPRNFPFLLTVHGNVDDVVYPVNTVFVSEDHAQRHGSSAFVYNGLDFEDYGLPDLHQKDDYFHFLGKAAWRVKNVKGAIRVAEKSGNKLIVVGGTRLNLKMGFRFTMNPRIRFRGMLGGEAKNAVLRKSRGLVFPVRWFEPFGLALIESMYYGCPVFGTPYGSLPELVPPQVGLLSASADELAYGLKHASDYSPEICHEYVRDNFSSRNMALKYISYYERVIHGESINSGLPTNTVKPEGKFLPWES